MQSFHELIINRRSIRKFTSQPIDPDQVRLILEAGLMSPAGKRRNPWHFIVTENREVMQALAQTKEHGAAPVADAAIAIALVADPADSDTWIEDLSIATIMMQLQCTDLGLGSVWIHMRERLDATGTPAPYNVQQILQIPENYQVLCVLAIGHPDEIRKPYDTDKLMWEKVHVEKF